PGQVDVEHLAIEKQKSAERLVLGGARNLAVDRERGQEAGDLGRAHLSGMPLLVEEDVAADPGDVGFLGPAAIVADPESLADAIEEARLRRGGRSGLADGREPAALSRRSVCGKRAGWVHNHDATRPP